MKASKKEFERLAMLVRALEEDREKRGIWSEGLANILEAANPLFDRARFIKACMEDKTVKEKT